MGDLWYPTYETPDPIAGPWPSRCWPRSPVGGCCRGEHDLHGVDHNGVDDHNVSTDDDPGPYREARLHTLLRRLGRGQ